MKSTFYKTQGVAVVYNRRAFKELDTEAKREVMTKQAEAYRNNDKKDSGKLSKACIVEVAKDLQVEPTKGTTGGKIIQLNINKKILLVGASNAVQPIVGWQFLADSKPNPSKLFQGMTHFAWYPRAERLSGLYVIEVEKLKECLENNYSKENGDLYVKANDVGEVKLNKNNANKVLAWFMEQEGIPYNEFKKAIGRA